MADQFIPKWAIREGWHAVRIANIEERFGKPGMGWQIKFVVTEGADKKKHGFDRVWFPVPGSHIRAAQRNRMFFAALGFTPPRKQGYWHRPPKKQDVLGKELEIDVRHRWYKTGAAWKLWVTGNFYGFRPIGGLEPIETVETIAPEDDEVRF